MTEEKDMVSKTGYRLDSTKADDGTPVSEGRSKEHMASDSEEFQELKKSGDIESSSDIVTLRSIRQELSQLRELFNKRFSYDRMKETAFERLYEELNEIKRNAAFENMKSLFLDLILLYDRMECLQREAKLDTEGRDSFRSLKEELLEILSRQEIHFIETKNEMFDAEHQQAVGTEKVDRVDESGKVVRTIRRGFRYRDRMLRPEEVIVTCYEKTNSDVGTAFEDDKHRPER